MPEISIRHVDVGPILNRPVRSRAARAFAADIEEETARETKREVDKRLVKVLRRPTGHYQSRIRVHKGRGGWTVDDDGIIYGFWLEGIGSRNAPVTRFPGYRTFRRTQPIIDRRASRIADRVWRTSGRRRFE